MITIQKILTKLATLTQKEITEIERLSGGFQNDVFRFKMDHQQYVARLTPVIKRSKALIEAELAFINLLRRNEIKMADAVLINGESISELIIDNERYWLTVFQYVKYKDMDVGDLSKWNVTFFYEWGKTIAQLHSISEKSLEKSFRPIWVNDDGEVNPIPSLLIDKEQWLKEIYKNILIKLASFPKTKQNFGLIHNDLHQGNFFVNSNQLILFDFDDCAYNWYVQDLSTSIYHALWTGISYHPEWIKFPQEFLEHFLNGYMSLRTLSEVDIVQIEIFMQIREVFLYLLFNKTWDIHNLEKWQLDKMLELEENLRHNRIPYETELENWKNETFNSHSS
jgi:Ser/Thr protein kinase RdoA (MazF antagonist)